MKRDYLLTGADWLHNFNIQSLCEILGFVFASSSLLIGLVQWYVASDRAMTRAHNDDMATFLLSGFQAASTIKAPPAPLPQPVIKSVVQGPVSGQLKVVIGPMPKALGSVIRRAQQPAAGATPAWVEETITTKKPVICSNLTPGTIYIFQV